MIITTNELSKGNYGVPCGFPESGTMLTCLSNNEVINFIDKYFGGSLGECETYTEDGFVMVCGGTPVISTQLTNQEIMYYYQKYINDKTEFSESVKYFSGWHDVNNCSDLKDSNELIDVETFDIENKYSELSPKLICYFFGEIIASLDGNVRCEHFYDRVELESE